MKINVCVFCFIIILIASGNFALHAQIVTTYAGGDTAHLDGVPAISVSLNWPNSVTFDHAGNTLIAEYKHPSYIRRVNAAGIITTVAGNGLCCAFSGDGGPATAATFSDAFDVAVDAMDNIYIMDLSHYRVRKVNTAGIINTVAGNGTLANTGDGGPATAAAIGAHGIDVDDSGNIYIAAGPQVRKVSAATGIITAIIGVPVPGFSGDGGPATAAQFGGIWDVALDKKGNMYMADAGNSRIRMVDTAGIVHTVAGNGMPGFSGDGGPATAAQLGTYTISVFVDEAGYLYMADANNHRVRRVDPLGRITTIAGSGPSAVGAYSGDGGPATAARFYGVMGVAKKKGGGNIFIADRNNGRVRMVTDTNHAAHYTGLHTAYINICAAPNDSLAVATDTVSIDAHLVASDTDTGQVDKWQLVLAPLHGTVYASFTTYSTGGAIMPAGFFYARTPGYVGFDTFKVSFTDGYTADTVTIYVRIDTSRPYAGVVTGPDTVCVGHNISLTGSAAGGIYSALNSNTSVAGNIITGVAVGTDTILYAVTNACGSDTTMHIVHICDCSTGIAPPGRSGAPAEVLHVFPNPNEGSFSVRLSSLNNAPVLITITDITGRKVKETTTTTNRETGLWLTGAGMYFVTVATETGRWYNKVVVNH